MVNEDFMQLSDVERKAKFRSALRSKTRDRLLTAELEDIILSASLKRQYEICVYYSTEEFQSVLALPHGVRGRTVLGQVLAGTPEQPGNLYSAERAAAIITRETANPDGMNRIHIFIPPDRLEKGSRCG